MPVTVTQAKSKTFTRIDLLATQIRISLRRTTDISDIYLELMKKGIKNKWLKQFHIYGLDNTNLCQAQLILETDWDEHNYQLSLTRNTVSIDTKKWQNNTAIEVDEAINLFNEFVKDAELTTEWRVFYSDEVEKDPVKRKEVQRELRLVDVPPINWAGETESGDISKITELPELRIGLRWLK